MIVKKTWERLARDTKGPNFKHFSYIDTYTGWFLLGFIPIYIVRSRRNRG